MSKTDIDQSIRTESRLRNGNSKDKVAVQRDRENSPSVQLGNFGIIKPALHEVEGPVVSNKRPQSEKRSDTRVRAKRSYSEEDQQIALMALDLNGGNVFRTAKARGIPYATLHGWAKARDQRRAEGIESPRAKELRGDLATKMESLLHDILEIMPTKLEKATLSQCAVTTGILTDKIRILRAQGLDPDPGAELCRLLNINRAQLPETLQLQPGEELPPGFEHIFETRTNRQGVIEPIMPGENGENPA